MAESYRKKAIKKSLVFRASLKNRNENIVKDFLQGDTFPEIAEEYHLHHYRCRQIIQETLKELYLSKLQTLSTARAKAKTLNRVLELKNEFGRLPKSSEIQTHFGRNYQQHFNGINEIRSLLKF